MDMITRLLEFDKSARRDGRKHPLRRDLHGKIAGEAGRHFIGLAGPRGAGKTVILKQWAAENKDAFYLSADVMEPDADLFEMAKTLSEKLGYKTLLLDEAHFNHDAPGHLKRIYDFLEMRVIFTSSVSMAIHSWEHDLSRRARVFRMGPLSLGEYLLFTGGEGDGVPPALSIEDLVDGRWSPEHLRAGACFDEYLRGGMLPFSGNEPNPLPLLRGILEKVVAQDIPSIGRPQVDELPVIRKLVDFVGRSAVDDINYSTLSRNLGITKYKAEQYSAWLEMAFVVKRVLPAGTNVLREPKILLVPPYRLLHRSYADAIGGLREDFFVESMSRIGAEVQYLKGTRGEKTPDYLVELPSGQVIFEVGGRSKGRTQFKGFKGGRTMVLAHSLTPSAGQIPLHLLGLVKAMEA
jgi:predicted AAA+ superfamily ATPase